MLCINARSIVQQRNRQSVTSFVCIDASCWCAILMLSLSHWCFTDFFWGNWSLNSVMLNKFGQKRVIILNFPQSCWSCILQFRGKMGCTRGAAPVYLVVFCTFYCRDKGRNGPYTRRILHFTASKVRHAYIHAVGSFVEPLTRKEKVAVHCPFRAGYVWC